jgi:hypothetical protein
MAQPGGFFTVPPWASRVSCQPILTQKQGDPASDLRQDSNEMVGKVGDGQAMPQHSVRNSR